MTLSFAIAIIVLADIALVAGLAYVMSHVRHLTPHVSAGASAAVPATAAPPAARTQSRRGRRVGSPLPAAS